VIDEHIASSPVVVEKGVLPKNVDKDPAWRATAIFERGELVQLLSDERIPRLRQVLNALKGSGRCATVRRQAPSGGHTGATSCRSASWWCRARTTGRAPRHR